MQASRMVEAAGVGPLRVVDSKGLMAFSIPHDSRNPVLCPVEPPYCPHEGMCLTALSWEGCMTAPKAVAFREGRLSASSLSPFRGRHPTAPPCPPRRSQNHLISVRYSRLVGRTPAHHQWRARSLLWVGAPAGACAVRRRAPLSFGRAPKERTSVRAAGSLGRPARTEARAQVPPRGGPRSRAARTRPASTRIPSTELARRNDFRTSGLRGAGGTGTTKCRRQDKPGIGGLAERSQLAAMCCSRRCVRPKDAALWLEPGLRQ